MDMSLDEIISTRPKKGRGGGPIRRRRSSSGRTQILGTAPSVSTTARAKAAAAAKVPPSPEKIMVSNLPADVNEQQIKELFASTVGPTKTVTLHYDAAGRSKGIAFVVFTKAGDGNKAFQQYNNRLIDGKRAMKIEIIVDPARAAPSASLASRVAPAPNGAPARGGKRGGGRGGRPKRTPKPPKTAADLDAEMEDYTAGANAPPAQPAA